MRFWDTSALVPLCIAQNCTEKVKELLRRDPAMAVWWGTQVECRSALARLMREGFLDSRGEEEAGRILDVLAERWSEIRPAEKIRQQAIRCISVHGLKAADSLQLAAALVWTENAPKGYAFVCLDQRLRTAARKEGFSVLPES